MVGILADKVYDVTDIEGAAIEEAPAWYPLATRLRPRHRQAAEPIHHHSRPAADSRIRGPQVVNLARDERAISSLRRHGRT